MLSGGIGKQFRAAIDYRHMTLVFLNTFYFTKKRKSVTVCKALKGLEIGSTIKFI